MFFFLNYYLIFVFRCVSLELFFGIKNKEKKQIFYLSSVTLELYRISLKNRNRNKKFSKHF